MGEGSIPGQGTKDSHKLSRAAKGGGGGGRGEELGFNPRVLKLHGLFPVL